MGAYRKRTLNAAKTIASKPLKEKKDGHAPSSAGDTSGDREAEIP